MGNPFSGAAALAAIDEHERLGLAARAKSLGVLAEWDAVLTAFEPVPFSLYLTAAPKLPLSILWDFALAFVLLRAPVR
jgi:hypothetical protein